MRVAVDTNVLIRFLTEDDLAQNEIASRVLESGGTIFISTIVLCETVWVLRRAYKYSTAQIGSVLSSLISIANVEVDIPAVETGLRFLAAGGDFADGVILCEAKRVKADTLATFDSGFADRGGDFVSDLNRSLPPA
jgi:predicted nucleic-acid-binding protein